MHHTHIQREGRGRGGGREGERSEEERERERTGGSFRSGSKGEESGLLGVSLDLGSLGQQASAHSRLLQNLQAPHITYSHHKIPSPCWL